MWILSAIANAIGSTFIGKPNYLFDLLFNRVQADGGVTEAEQCTINELTDLQNENLLKSASLMLTPTSYKEGKLYSIIPENGDGDFTFTRATTATRVNSDGLVELVPYNFLFWSQQFENASWGKTNATITANSTTAPDGTLTADTITSTGTDGRALQAVGINANQDYTFSVWLKSTTGSNVNASIRSVGNPTAIVVTSEWQRFTITQSYPTAATRFPGISGIASGDSVYVWGAQVNEGSSALPYQKTETRLNIPRLDYSNGTCPSILLEPQRTNLLLQSSSFDSASWSKGGGSTVVANTTIAPDGTLTADTLNIPNNGNVSQAYNAPTNATRILTFYLKADSNVTVKIAFFTPSIVATCNLTTEWQRFEITHTWSGTVYPQIYNDSGSSVSIYAWGAQLEAGSYATSYIPTTTASVTRNAEVLSKTGISSLIGQTEGTMFAEMKINSSSEFRVISISDGSTNNRVVFAVNGITDLRVFSVYGGTVGTAITTSIPSGTIKIAVRYTASNYSFFVNGVLVGTQSQGAFTNTLSVVSNHQGNGGNSFYGYVKQLQVFQTALSDDELEVLTGEGFDTYALMANNYNYILQ